VKKFATELLAQSYNLRNLASQHISFNVSLVRVSPVRTPAKINLELF
jgi:hypothetical protein